MGLSIICLSIDYLIPVGLSFLSHNGDEVKVTFHPISTSDVQEEILSQLVSQGSSDNSKDQSSTEKGGPTSMIQILISKRSSRDFLSLLIWEKLKCLNNNKSGSWN